MARNPRWSTVLGTAGLCGLLGCHETGSLEVTLVDCDEVRRGPICLLAPDKTFLRLAVETVPGSELTMEAAGQPLRLTCDGSSDEVELCLAQSAGNVLRVRLPANRERLRLIAKSPGRNLSRKYDLTIAPEEPLAPWLVEAAALRSKSTQPHAAELLVRARLAPGARPELSPTERAQAYGELARCLQEQLHLGEAESAFKEAIRLDEQAGLLWNKASHLIVLSDILFDQRRLFALEQLLYDNQELFNLMGRWRPWPALYRAQNAHAMGDPEQALRHLDQADRLNQLCGDSRSINTATWLRSRARAALGIEREDAPIKEAATGVAAFSCRHGLLLGEQADLRIQLLASELGEDVQPDAHALERLANLWQRWETAPVPEPAARLLAHGEKLQALLDQSLGVLNKGRCAIPKHLGTVLLSQAHLALLLRNPASARERLAQVHSLLAEARVEPEQLPHFSVEWNRLSAQLARAEGRFADALSHTNLLAKYTGDDVNSFEIQWTMLFGRALALSKQGETYRAEALVALRSANAVIEDASRSAPLLLGRGPLLGRFEWGSRLLLELLLRVDPQGKSHASQAELIEALQLMRHLRTRPLLGLKRLELVQRLDPARRQQWTAAVVQYLSARRELEEAVMADQPKKQREQLKEQVHKRLAAAMAILGDAELPQPRRAAADEVFLICHPLYSRWACLLGSEQKVWVSTLSAAELREPAVTEAGTSTLLTPFTEPLARAKVVSVLGYGDFRRTQVDLLPLAGRPLGKQLAVRYSLDIGTSAVPVRQRRAVLAIDAKLEYAEAGDQPLAIGAPLLAALRSGQGWQSELMNLGMHGTVGGAVGGGKTDLRQAIPSAGLLLLFGHMDYAPGSGWINGINWTPWSHLTGGDIMISVGGVPARVILIACSSGDTEDLIGGHEALGLAQAFLLRGSHEVLATTRAVTAEAGTLVATKVLAYLAAKPEESLTRALLAATAELSGPNPNEPIERTHGDGSTERGLLERVRPQLDAFRVITP